LAGSPCQPLDPTVQGGGWSSPYCSGGSLAAAGSAVCRVAKSRMCIYTLYIHIRYIYAVYDKNALFWAYTYVTVDIVYIRQNGVYIRYIPYALSLTSQAVNITSSHKAKSYLIYIS
jgi:hypothetical protein